MALHLRKQLVTHIQRGDRNVVGVLEGDLLTVIEKGARLIVRDIENLLDGDAQPAAHGSVNVLSEDASIQSRHSTIDQSRQLTV